MEQLDGSVELILVNDGGRDRSLQLLHNLHQKRICYLSLARNFGHQIAVTAGLNFVGVKSLSSRRRLTRPPELIPDMIESGDRAIKLYTPTQRRQEGWFKRFTAYGFYRLLKHLADVDIPTDTGDFCLLDRRVTS